MQESPISWSAYWISSSVIGASRITAPVPFLRKTFRVEGSIESAVLHITALGAYECEVNGRLVTENVFVPGWIDYRKRVAFQSYDVTALLSSGANAIGVIVQKPGTYNFSAKRTA
jgi:alpha-L-rhamnosidase